MVEREAAHSTHPGVVVGRHDARHPLRMRYAVVVNKQNHIAAGMGNTDVARFRKVAALATRHLQWTTSLLELAQDLLRIVGGRPVHNDQFGIAVGLLQYRLDRVAQVGSAVVGVDDDTGLHDRGSELVGDLCAESHHRQRGA